MGEAKRKKLAQLMAATGSRTLSATEINQVKDSVKQVVGAVTDYHGADCLLYAHVGADLLRSLGMDAKMVAGSAIWRIGSGDGDVISHAREINGAKYAQEGAQNAGMFHAWIEAPGLVIDFSTSTLRSKAKQLDEADGGTTQVDWCPDMIWHSTITPDPKAGTAVNTPKNVQMAMNAGVFNYTRHEDIEAVVLQTSDELKQSMKNICFGAQAAYAAISRGETLRIIGLSEEGGGQEVAPEPARLMQMR